MKRVLFLLVSALLAGATYASNLSKDVIAMVTNSHEVSITEQEQSLILKSSAILVLYLQYFSETQLTQLLVHKS